MNSGTKRAERAASQIDGAGMESTATKKTTRRTISVRGTTFDRLREHTAVTEQSMSDFVEDRIAEYFKAHPVPAAKPSIEQLRRLASPIETQRSAPDSMRGATPRPALSSPSIVARAPASPPPSRAGDRPPVDYHRMTAKQKREYEKTHGTEARARASALKARPVRHVPVEEVNRSVASGRSESVGRPAPRKIDTKRPTSETLLFL
jgi:hypothetical protein